jgi:preprotein translocase subunit SecE
MMKKSGTKKENRFFKFLRGTKSELKKIVWPTWKQTLNKTLIVCGVVVLFAVLIAALDLLFNVSIIRWFTK